MQLFILSCGDIADEPNNGNGEGDIKPDPSSFLGQVVDKVLIDSKGYYLSYHSDGGKNYTDYTGRTYIFVNEISSSKAVYKRQHLNFYYGHEIREGVLYVTDEDASSVNSINWGGAKIVGELTVDYSASFLNHVIGKTIEACQRYFDQFTGRKYLTIGQPTQNAFDFVQALSATKAIYENETDGKVKFIGISTVGLDLYETEESDNFSKLDWDGALNVGVLE